ncbi:class I SAM-dependent methyltransferase [Marinicella sp. W31]|uniref:class I SAM-dependent methyltransferase n=1 Tax=Marinicella sp. W31 TaxID=3023713 RepID=UPI003756FA09
MNWYQDEQLWEIFYDSMFDADSFAVASEQVPKILSMVPAKVNKVLDLACGPGRHLIPFAQMGLDVTGVDSSGFLLNRAAHMIESEDLAATLVHADMLDYETTTGFDLVTNLFTSFGYYEDPQDNQKLLAQIHHMLKDSGYLVLDVFGKENLLQTMEPVHLTEYDNGDIRVERPLLTDEMQVFSNEWILIRGDQAYRKQYQHYVYSGVELRQMLKQAGFSSVKLYGSFDADPYDMESERLIAVAQK